MSIANSIRAQIPPIHPEGYPFIGAFAAVSLILFWIWTPLGWIGTALTVWCALFFRDPVRVTPVRDGIVVTRTGSRKNSAHQTVSSVPIQPSGVQIQNSTRLASAKPPMKG